MSGKSVLFGEFVQESSRFGPVAELFPFPISADVDEDRFVPVLFPSAKIESHDDFLNIIVLGFVDIVLGEVLQLDPVEALGEAVQELEELQELFLVFIYGIFVVEDSLNSIKSG